jgi:hypothetical protein
MFPISENQVFTLTDVELDWCHEHKDVPEAAWVLSLYESINRSGETPQLHGELMNAVIALRKIQPRPLAIIDKFFAWVVFNPQSQVEAIPGFLEGGMVNLMMACDMEHVRSLVPKAREIEDHMSSRMNLFRFDIDRVIPDEEIQNLTSENLKTKTVQELFAFVGPAPTGDETVLGVMTNAGGMPLAHANAEEIKRYWGAARMIKNSGQKVELRRFLRTGSVSGI